MYRSQMKAETIDDASQFRYPCYVSEKLDGWRCLVVDGVMFTSGGKPFSEHSKCRVLRLVYE